MRSYQPKTTFEKIYDTGRSLLFYSALGLASALGCGGGDTPVVNNAPIAEDDTIIPYISEDSGVNSLDVLTNDTDAEDGAPSLDAIVSDPLNGTAVINVVDKKIDYTPNANFFGKDSFTYRVRDSGGLTDTASVNITVNPVNDAPTMEPLSNLVVKVGNSVSLSPVINDVDGDIVSVSYPAPFDSLGNFTATENNMGNYSGLTVIGDDTIGGIVSRSFNMLVHSPYNDLTGKLNYIIITSNALKESFIPLRDWKTRKGVMTEIFTIEDIEGTLGYSSGRDTQENIRNFLIDKKFEHLDDPEYVLLGGDVEVVPHRQVYAECTLPLTDNTVPCDLYFSDLDGDWDADNDGGLKDGLADNPENNLNGGFGESNDGVDMHPDLFVGRAPVNTAAEAGVFVDKVLLYETGKDSGGSVTLNTGYLNNRLACADVLQTTPITNAADRTNWIHKTVINFNERLYKDDTDYDDLGNPVGTLGRTNLESKASVISALNSGFHIVNLYGHGHETGISVGDGYLNCTGSENDADIRTLTNSTTPFILYSLGCMTNAFDNTVVLPSPDDCIGEHFVLNPAGGAVAVIGESRIGLYTTTATDGRGVSWDYNWRFFEALQDPVRTNYALGKIFADSKDYYVGSSKTTNDYRWIQYCLNLLGDPEMNVWTGYSGNFTITKNIGTRYTEILVKDGLSALVENAKVVIKDGNNVYSALTDAAGRAVIPATGTVTIIKQNFLPFVE